MAESSQDKPSSRPSGRIVSVQTTTERGGAEYANVDLLEALSARGHDVVLLTNDIELAAGTSVPVCRLELGPKLSRRTKLTVLLRAPLSLARLTRSLRAQRPVAVVMAHFKKEQLLCALLPPRVAPNVVWAEWGPVPPPMRSGPARLVYALAARRASGIMAVSEGTRRSIVQAGVPETKVEVVPNLVDVHSVRPDPRARERLRGLWRAGTDTLVIGCISRFQRRKRNDVVIDAMAYVSGEVLLVMAGEGDMEAALRERAEPYGEHVRFEPNVRGHVEEFLSACDVLVFAPSPTEGEPRVIVMSQLVGVPVIATDSEGAEGLIPPGGGTIVSPSHDPHALGAALEAYRVDRERCRREGEIARAATLESHDPERTLQAIERLLGV